MRTAYTFVLVAAVVLLCHGLATAATVDYPIRIDSVGMVAGLPTNFMHQAIMVNTGSDWVDLTSFLSETVPTALNAGALPAVGGAATAMRNVPVDAGKCYVPWGLKPIWLRVDAMPAAGITYHESRGERGRGTLAHCWKWSSHFVTTFQAWAPVDKLVHRTAVKDPGLRAAVRQPQELLLRRSLIGPLVAI